MARDRARPRRGRASAVLVALGDSAPAGMVAVIDYHPATYEELYGPTPLAAEPSLRALPPVETTPANPVRLRSLEEISVELDSAPPRRFLVENIVAEAESMVIVGEKKSGKSVLQADLGVSVSSGTPWLGRFPTTQGPVIIFSGEDTLAEFRTRVVAICEHRGLDLCDVWSNIYADCVVPRLADPRHVDGLLEHVERLRAKMVCIDPAYLANAGLDMRDLYAMGEALRRLTLGAGELGCATVFGWHTNRSDRSRAIDKATGAGPVEVARSLIGLEVRTKRTDHRGVEHAQLRLERRGSSVPDESWSVIRRMWRDDPSDLASPLHYEVEVQAEVEAVADGMHAGLRRVLAALTTDYSSYEEIGDRQAADGSAFAPQKVDTLKRYLGRLADLGHAEHDGATGTTPKRWRLSGPVAGDVL